ncbi:MAG: hypothetical protein OTJ45_02295 [Alphaproteobacteria bacterium]|nr:hypothetical protein [Alphaproteobacteria bacterium]MCX8230636.1 hypothetical protein [Alphaproteobacteria bacterium]
MNEIKTLRFGPRKITFSWTAAYGHAGSIATMRDAVTAHFDSLRGIDVNAISSMARQEYFKRMAANGDD